MAASTVRLEADISALSRAFGQMRAQYSSALAAMRSDARREATARVALERQALAEQNRNQRAAARAQAAEARASAREQARIARDLNRQRQREEAASVRAKQSAEAAAVRAAESSAKAQQRAFSRMLREKIGEERRAAAEADRIRRQQQANEERAMKARLSEQAKLFREEARLRQQAANAAMRDYRQQQRAHERTMTSRGATIGRGIAQVAGAGAAVATDVHGQIQDARARRANANRTLGGAARAAGMSAAEEAAMRARVSEMQIRYGIRYEDTAAALLMGQEGGQALEGATPEARTRALNEALETLRDANASGVNMGQFLTARGRLRAAGLTGGSLNESMRFVLGAAREGNVEVDQIIRQGLPGAAQLMQARESALGPNASAEDRMRARATAFRESVALQEVSARSGMQPGNVANTLASVQSFLNTPRRQEMMLNNIRNARRALNTRTPEGRAQAQRFADLESELFERDPTRRGNAMRMRSDFAQSPLALTERLAAATRGNANEAANLFAGGGQGNPQALLANQRRLFAFLGSQGGEVRRMMNATTSDQQLQDFRTRTENDDLARLTRAEGERDRALLENTETIRGMSDRFAAWTTANPLGSAAAKGALGLGTTALSAFALPRIGGGIARGASYLWTAGRLALGAGGAAAAGGAGVAAGGSAAGGAAAGGAAAAAGGIMAPVAAALAAIAGALVFAGGTSGVISGRNMRGEELSTGERVARGVVGASGGGALLINAYDSFRARGGVARNDLFINPYDSFRRALQETPVQVVVDPHSAQQLASTNASRNASGGR